MSKKFKDLTADDFPAINPTKFADWKKAKTSSTRNMIVGYSVLFLIMLLATLKVIKFGAIGWLLCAFAGIIINYFANTRFSKLSKELNLSRHAIRDVLKKS